MVGNINMVFYEYISLKHSPEAWIEIADLLKLKEQFVVQGSAYPDAMTYKIAEAASSILKIPKSKILHEIGKYYVVDVLHNQYDNLKLLPGKTLKDILEYLPTYHNRLGIIQPYLHLPTFLSRPLGERGYEIWYKGETLDDHLFIIGLLDGIIQVYNYGVSATVKQTKKRSSKEQFDVYEIHW